MAKNKQPSVSSNVLKQWPTELMDITSLLPAGYNPRRITQHALVGLQNSLSQFGLVQPIVWNRNTGNVVGGHQRLEAMKALGETKAQVIVVELSDTQERALNLTLNNPAIQGSWNDEKLEELIASLQAADDFDVESAQDTRLDELIAQFSTSDILLQLPDSDSGSGLEPDEASYAAVVTDAKKPSYARMVSVFMTDVEEGVFYERVNQLKASWGFDTLSEVVVEAVKQCSSRTKEDENL